MAHHAEALKLLEDVVNINSGTMNFDGVYKAGQVFKARFDALGFETKWLKDVGLLKDMNIIVVMTGDVADPYHCRSKP